MDDERVETEIYLKKKNQMKGIPKEEQPYEKCISLGVGALTDAELLAIILRSGTKRKSALEVGRALLKKKEEGILGVLKLSLEDLISIEGIGDVKGIQILAVAELARRAAKQTARHKLDFSNPASIADYYMEDMRHLQQEQLILVMLNGKNKLIKDKVLFVGTVNQSLVNPREIFIEAIKNEAVNIILLHNHPSGDIQPSRSDLLITKRIKEAGDLVGIKLLDHIIIGDRKYNSLFIKD